LGRPGRAPRRAVRAAGPRSDPEPHPDRRLGGRARPLPPRPAPGRGVGFVGPAKVPRAWPESCTAGEPGRRQRQPISRPSPYH
jgi:hypothetical protein